METSNGRIGKQFYRGNPDMEGVATRVSRLHLNMRLRVLIKEKNGDRTCRVSSRLRRKLRCPLVYFGEKDRGREEKIEKEREDEKKFKL